MKSVIILLIIFSISIEYLEAQPVNEKKDTLYYLIDSTKTPKLDRIMTIIPTRIIMYYQFDCPCFPNTMQPNLTFFYFLVKWPPGTDPAFPHPVFIKKRMIKQIPFTSLRSLIQIACKEKGHFKFNHVVFFIEHLPNGKYTKMRVLMQEPRVKDD